MPVSFKLLCVANEKINEVPKSKITNGQIINKEFSGQSVLKVEMGYETMDKKPYKILHLHFNRITFNGDGVYYIGNKHAEEQVRIKLEYTLHSLTENIPLPIPSAPIKPTKVEIDAIKTYLNHKYPALLSNTPYAIEETLQLSKIKHEENIKKMKQSHKKSSI